MEKEILILPDGSRLSSGVCGENAIMHVSYTASVNDGDGFCPGSACAAMLECTVFAHEDPGIAVGDTLLYCLGETQVGVFSCQQLQRSGQYTYKLTAYDRMILFDREADGLLAQQSFPCSLQSLFDSLCADCGVDTQLTLPGGDYEVGAFSATALTGRQLLKWIAQACGRFFYMDAVGMLQCAWYGGEPRQLARWAGIALAGGDLLATAQAQPYGTHGSEQTLTLSCADFTTDPIERVLIRSEAEDVGTVYPDGSDSAGNTYIIEGNPLLSVGDNRAVAQRLYAQLRELRYVPFTATLLPGSTVQPGQTVTFFDAGGSAHTSVVMHLTVRDGIPTVSATGSRSLQSVQAYNTLTYGALTGKVLSLERTAQGLHLQNRDAEGRLSELSVTVDGLRTQVAADQQSQYERFSALEQTAQGLSLAVTQVQSAVQSKADADAVQALTEHFRFDADGMTIKNSATGMGIGVSEKSIVFNGGSDPTTQILPSQMRTTDLKVLTRLDVGNFSFLPRTNGNLSFRYTKEVE